MQGRIDLGRNGEDLAAEWLTTHGYKILERNWRHGRCEVDIIALRNDTYHFIEVKTGHSGEYGYPEERVTPAKIRNMMRASVAWQSRLPGVPRVQYDVLAITIRQGVSPEFYLFEDVHT